MITIRPGRKVYTIPGPDFGVRVIEPGAVAAADWWLGPWPNYPGVPAIVPGCAEGVYRAVNTPGTPWPGGPNVYADTLVNLADAANPLVEGAGAVPWNILTGWGFVEGARQWFDTGLVPASDQSWSALVQFTCVTNTGYAFGMLQTVPNNRYFAIQPWRPAGPGVYYLNGCLIEVLPPLLTGNLAVAGAFAYRDGVPDGGPIGGWGGVPTDAITIGALRLNGGIVVHITADIESLAIYSCTLTPGQVLALADPVLGAMPNL